MRSIVHLCAYTCLLLLVNAKMMEIHKSDGSVQRYCLSDVKKMTFGQDLLIGTGPGAAASRRPVSGPALFVSADVVTVSVPAASAVRIELFDALGRLVAGIHEGVHQPGTYRFRIEKTAGAGPSTGWYLVRASIGERILLRSVVVHR